MDIRKRLFGLTCTKDHASVITECNDVFLEYLGFNNDSKVIGRTDYELCWQDRADLYRRHELDAFCGNNYSTVIPIKLANGDDAIFMHTKTQKTDALGEALGVHCHSVEIINPNVNCLFTHLQNITPAAHDVFYLNRGYEKYNLTRREKDILFFICRGKTAKTISKVLSLSPHTVTSHIENIKAKMNCRTKAELADIAYEEGFSQLIPKLSANKIYTGLQD